MSASLTTPDAYIFDPKYFNSDTKFNTSVPAIDELNLNRIVVKSMDANSGYGWDQEYASEIAKLYRIFLFLCLKYPDQIIVPPYEVDQFWHLHILDTRNYHTDCERIFGSYMHHYPYAGLDGTGISHEDEELLKQNTLRLVEKHFPEILES